jgi:hypothetical protein
MRVDMEQIQQADRCCVPPCFRQAWLKQLVRAIGFLGVPAAMAQPVVQVNAVVVEQPIEQMVFDSLRSQFIFTIPDSDPVNGELVGFLDPITTELLATVDLGSLPGAIAITDDAQAIHVGVREPGAVKTFDLGSGEVVQTALIGTGGSTLPRWATVITPQPGSDSSFSVALEGGIVGAVDHYTGGAWSFPLGWSQVTALDLHFKPGRPDRMVSLAGSGQFRTMALVNGTFSTLSNIVGLFNDFALFTLSRLAVQDSLALTNNGSLIDISGDLPIPVGTCNVNASYDHIRRAAFDPYEGLIVIAHRNSELNDTLRLIRFNAQTLVAQDVIKVGVPGTGNLQVSELICWGPNGRYAISTSNGKLVIINGDTIPTELAGPVANSNDLQIHVSADQLWVDAKVQLRLELLDLQGRVLERSDGSGRLAIGELAAALYVVRFSDQAGQVLGARKWLLTD